MEATEYCIVRNIPETYHSADLRVFFSDFLESRGFVCFYFMHRPELIVMKQSVDELNCESDVSVVNNDEYNVQAGSLVQTISTTTCCVIRVLISRVQELIDQYDQKYWHNDLGEGRLSTRCSVSKIEVADFTACTIFLETCGARTKKQRKKGLALPPMPNIKEVFTEKELKDMVELNPPATMPNGNVGTPTLVFWQLKCFRGPAAMMPILRKLRIRFPANVQILCSEEFSDLATVNFNKYQGVKLKRLNQALGLQPAKKSKKAKQKVAKLKNAPVPKKPADDKIGAFEEHTKGIGRKLLEKYGWKDGDGLGDTVKGIAVALENEGQAPNVKKGFGFQGKNKLPQSKQTTVNQQIVPPTNSQQSDDNSQPVGGNKSKQWLKPQSQIRVAGVAIKNKGALKQSLQLQRMAAKIRKKKVKALQNRVVEFNAKQPRSGKIGTFEEHTMGVGRMLLEKWGWQDGDGLGDTIMATASENHGQDPFNKKGFGFQSKQPTSGMMTIKIVNPNAKRPLISPDLANAQFENIRQEPHTNRNPFIRSNQDHRPSDNPRVGLRQCSDGSPEYLRNRSRESHYGRNSELPDNLGPESLYSRRLEPPHEQSYNRDPVPVSSTSLNFRRVVQQQDEYRAESYNRQLELRDDRIVQRCYNQRIIQNDQNTQRCIDSNQHEYFGRYGYVDRNPQQCSERSSQPLYYRIAETNYNQSQQLPNCQNSQPLSIAEFLAATFRTGPS